MTVILRDFNETQVFASYGMFQVRGPETFYRLQVGDYTGTAG